MLAVQRRAEILYLLGRRSAVSVEEMAQSLAVSPSTVRRDLDALEVDDLVRRVHGGAVLAHTGEQDVAEPPLAEREVENADEKRGIAEVALDLVVPGSTLLVTGGTTTGALVSLLAGMHGLSVVTNSLDVAVRLASADVDLVVLGGALRRPELSLLGTLVGVGLAEVQVDHAFMGVYGINPSQGALGASASECATDRLLIRKAERVTILADSSKFHRRSPHLIAPVSFISHLITGAEAPAEDLDKLREQGVYVKTVP